MQMKELLINNYHKKPGYLSAYLKKSKLKRFIKIRSHFVRQHAMPEAAAKKITAIRPFSAS